jgi:hypothetical protein
LFFAGRRLPPKLCDERLQVKHLWRNIIEATVLTEYEKGETVFISRIPLIPSGYPFEFNVFLFPLNCVSL